MKMEAWFQALTRDPAISAIIPMELQPGMPLPLLCGEKLLFYVPYYRVQPMDAGVGYSGVLMEVCFAAVTRRIVSVKDLRVFGGASAKELHETRFPEDSRLREQELICQDLFHQLDLLENEYRQTKTVSSRKLDNYTLQLRESLLYPELWRRYAEVRT